MLVCRAAITLKLSLTWQHSRHLLQASMRRHSSTKTLLLRNIKTLLHVGMRKYVDLGSSSTYPIQASDSFRKTII